MISNWKFNSRVSNVIRTRDMQIGEGLDQKKFFFFENKDYIIFKIGKRAENDEMMKETSVHSINKSWGEVEKESNGILLFF